MSQFETLSASESDAAYKDLVKSNRPLQIQIAGERLRQAKATERKNGEIYFTLPPGQRFEGTHEAVVSFSLPPDVFFMKTKVVGAGGNFFLVERSEIFRLQRRESFRLMVPAGTQAEVLFEDGERYPVYDLSHGGFGIELPAIHSDRYVTGSQMYVDLEVEGETFSKILCETKHARIQPANKKRVLVGFQFLKLKARQSEVLFRLITDIARAHFRR
jgi:hypothetical protein